jgi:hypothetical protein
MLEYRAYVLDPEGRVMRRVDDATAERQARQLVDGHDVELWSGNRKIASFARHRP